MKLCKVFIITLALSLGIAWSWADTIWLKSGDQIDGVIIEETDEYIKINSGGVVLRYEQVEIDQGKQLKALKDKEPEKKYSKENISLTIKERIIKGTELLKRGKFAEAANEFIEIISIDKDNEEANYNLGCAYFGQKDYSKAVGKFNLALANDSSSYRGITYFNIAMAYQKSAVEKERDISPATRSERLKLAERSYKKCIETLPYLPQAYRNLAFVLYYQHQPQELVNKYNNKAIELANELGDFNPDILMEIYSYHSYSAQINIANNYIMLDDLDKAKSELVALISDMQESPPKDRYLLWSAYNALGYCYFYNRDLDEALDSFKKSLTLGPNQPEADLYHSNIGIIYFEKGDLVNAKKEFKKAKSINPANRTAEDYLRRLQNKGY